MLVPNLYLRDLDYFWFMINRTSSRNKVIELTILNHSPNTGHPLQTYYSRIYKTYDLVNHLFTLGFDRKWRRHAAHACLKNNPQHILDLCCGTGDLAIAVAQTAKKPIHIIGFDLNPDMIKIARKKALNHTINSIEFIQGNAGSMPFNDAKFDCITIGFGFRNLTFENPNRAQYLKEISRVLKPGGSLLILESAPPDGWFVNFFYHLYLKLVLVPLGGLLSGDRAAYSYLAASSTGFYNYEDIQIMLGDFQFELQLVKKYLFGAVNLLIANKI